MKKKYKLSWFTQIGTVFGLAAITAALLFISCNILKNRLLSSSEAKTKAVIINEENYNENNLWRFSYSYRFYQNGRAYTGNSLDSRHQVGDSVWVKYVPSFPRFNQIIEPDE